MKMPKINALLMTAGMCLALMTACGDNGAAETEPAETETPAAEEGGFQYDGSPVELVMQCHDPQSSICGAYLEDWENMMTEASEGNITFVNYFGGSLVRAAESVEIVKNGGADLCWGAATIYSGQFRISEFLSLPLSGITCARMGCKVFMNMYETIPALQSEYSAYHVIQLSQCTTMPISLASKKLETLADFQGLCMRVSGSTASLWATAIGISPMTVATHETYESLEKNVIKACAND